MTQASNIAFAQWVKTNDPFLFEVAKKRFELKKTGMNGLGLSLSDFNIGDFAKSLMSTVKEVAPGLVQYKTQTKILKTQLKRAEKGLPPLQTSEYAPTLNVSAEITPEMEAAALRVAQSSVGSGLNTILPYAAVAALVGFMLINRGGRRR